ncbi:hypothetical protein V2W45_1338690 [Cenococcum geophilum]
MAEKKGRWPEVGRVDPNHNAHSQNITVEIAKILEFSTPPHEKADGKALPYRVYKPFFNLVLKYIKIALKQPTRKKLEETLIRLKR